MLLYPLGIYQFYLLFQSPHCHQSGWKDEIRLLHVITSYSIHYTKLYEEQKSGESLENSNASIKETDLVTAYELLRSATSSEKSKKENIVISETMTVALKNATEEQLQVLSNLTQEEFTNSMNQVAQIVDSYNFV